MYLLKCVHALDLLMAWLLGVAQETRFLLSSSVHTNVVPAAVSIHVMRTNLGEWGSAIWANGGSAFVTHAPPHGDACMHKPPRLFLPHTQMGLPARQLICLVVEQLATEAHMQQHRSPHVCPCSRFSAAMGAPARPNKQTLSSTCCSSTVYTGSCHAGSRAV
jgi:hypothetical protein